MPVTCPFGAQVKPGLQPFVYGWEIAVQVAEQFTDYPIIGNVVDSLDWVVFDVQWVADHGPLEYPVFTALDFVDKLALAAKMKDYFDAFLWDKFCECKPHPDG